MLGMGYVLVAWISLGTYYANSETVQWRLPLALSIVPALIMAVGIALRFLEEGDHNS